MKSTRASRLPAGPNGGEIRRSRCGARPRKSELLARGAGVTAALDHLDTAMATVSERWRQPVFFAQIKLISVGTALAADAVGSLTEADRRPLLDWVESKDDIIAALLEKTTQKPYEMGPEGRAWLARLRAERGRLLHLAGRPEAPAVDELVALWKAAADGFGYGARYEQSRSRARLAELQRAAGDLAGATESANAAREFARSVGARPLLDQLATLAVPARRHAEPSTALTPRESEVLGTDRRRPHQPPDRSQPLHLGEDGERARVQPAGQARGVRPHRGGRDRPA